MSDYHRRLIRGSRSSLDKSPIKPLDTPQLASSVMAQLVESAQSVLPDRDRSLALTTKVAAIGALALVYFLAGKLGLQLAFVHQSATAVWPPTGLALATLLVFGYWLWPGIILGAFLVNVATTGSIFSSLGIAVGNTLEGLIGAYLVNRLARGRQTFDRPPDVLRFAALGGLVSPAVSATVGVTTLTVLGHADWSRYGGIWLTWWLGDMGGAIVVAPLLVLWFSEPRPRWTPPQVLEAAFLLIALLLIGEMVFGDVLPIAGRKYPLPFLMIPVLVWAALRFGPRETATLMFLTSGIAIWRTLQGLGPFAREPHNEALLLLQVFTGVMAVMALALAAGVAQHRRTEHALRDAQWDLERRVKERTAELAKANAALRAEIMERQHVEERLEKRVQERTLALARANEALQEKIADLEQFEQVVVGRELKMIELEKELERLQRTVKGSDPG
jgi:integral membrane sensor domain MASE1